MKRIAALLCIYAVLVPLNASAQNHVWSHAYGGPSADIPNRVATDSAGNVLVLGSFDDTINFGGGYLYSVGLSDIFLAKFDSNGGYLWGLRAGGSQTDEGRALAVDGSGNVIIAGNFSGTINFGGGDLTSAGLRDIYLAKFSAGGTHLWSHRYGTTTYEYANTVAVDASGNIVVTGNFRSPLDLGGGALSNQTTDAFLARYDPDGNHLWSKRFGGGFVDSGKAVAVDAEGNILLLSDFSAVATFGGAPLTNQGLSDLAIAKFSPDGTHLWSAGYGGPGADNGSGVAVDQSGNVFITGYFTESSNLGGSTLVSAGFSDVFLAKYDASGTPQWSRRFGSASEDFGNAVAVDGQGNVLVTGRYELDVDFGGGNLGNMGRYEVFLAQYNADGNYMWSRRYGGLDWDEGTSLAVDGAQNILLAGRFERAIELGGTLFTGFGFAEAFVMKLSPIPTAVLETPAINTLAISNTPNPFNPRTTIRYTVPSNGPVTVAVYDVRGAQVALLVDNENRTVGTHRVDWDGRGADGTAAPSGVYFVRLTQNERTQTAKLVLLK